MGQVIKFVYSISPQIGCSFYFKSFFFLNILKSKCDIFRIIECPLDIKHKAQFIEYKRIICYVLKHDFQ